MFGESSQLLRALRSEVDPRPLIKQISRPEGQEITPSPHSSLLAFEGNVCQQTASPTPNKIEEDLSCFPPSPPDEIKGIRVQIFEATLPPCLQINAIIALCKAIVSYKEDNLTADDHIYVVTEGLNTFIKAMAEHNESVPLPITYQEYNCITHLTYISSFTDAIKPYTIENKQPKTLLECLTTPSHISVSDEEELIHPGEGWHEYDAQNPKHYPLVFVNENREEKVARFIRYLPVGDRITLQGKHAKHTPTYGAPLHARPFPHPNFNGNTPCNMELAIFHPSAINCITVDDVLLHLGDAGVIADVHTLREQHLCLATIQQQ